jgi:arsenate reductase
LKTVIFGCVHNAGRSQMAAAFFNALVEGGKAVGVSAGTAPGKAVHPEVLEAMREVGIDLAGAKPRLLTDELARTADLLVTMGCGERCPFVPGLRIEDWPIDDPKGRPMAEVRRIREDVRARVLRLLEREFADRT